MPNIAAVLREEILRLSRREARGQILSAKRATVQHRKDIAQLKRQVAALQSQVKRLSRMETRLSAGESAAPAGKQVRFVAKGLRSQRLRLGLSANELGKLIGVSGQSIYNWESGDTRPRAEQIARLATLRGLGKRAAQARLKQSSAPKARAKHR